MKLLAAPKMPSWLTPVVTVSYWMISAIIAPGSTLSTANGKETKSANTQASTSRFPGSLSLKQMTISAMENTMKPSIIGSFLPFFFANLFTSGYISSELAMDIASISTE